MPRLIRIATNVKGRDLAAKMGMHFNLCLGRQQSLSRMGDKQLIEVFKKTIKRFFGMNSVTMSDSAEPLEFTGYFRYCSRNKVCDILLRPKRTNGYYNPTHCNMVWNQLRNFVENSIENAEHKLGRRLCGVCWKIVVLSTPLPGGKITM